MIFTRCVVVTRLSSPLTTHVTTLTTKPAPLEKYDVTYRQSGQKREILKDLNFNKNNINVSKVLRDIENNVQINPQKNSENDLTQFYWIERTVKISDLPNIYMQLSKFRLTTLVVLTAMAGFVFNPIHGSLAAFTALTAGTYLCSASANTFNQVMEAPFDSQMDRCRQRVLVKKLITPVHAAGFGLLSGVLGVSTLYCFTNALTAGLGLANILLYTGVYTTMKRYTIANTWVGAIVGAIPPAMGWAACTGTLDVGAIALCGVLYCWQFPHFNALSYNVRQDYCRAGYNMMSVVDTALNARVALRNTAALIPLCAVMPFTGISHCSFSFYSLIVNTYFTYLAWNFYKDPNKQTARELFRFSLVYLPIIFAFLGIAYAFKERTSNEDKHHNEKTAAVYIRELCPFLPKSKENPLKS